MQIRLRELQEQVERLDALIVRADRPQPVRAADPRAANHPLPLEPLADDVPA